jgi:hypothetical protein
MMRDPKIVLSIAALVATSTFTFSPAFSDDAVADTRPPTMSQMSFEDELDDYLEAKEKLNKALELYKNATSSNIQERYKNALAAYKSAAAELKNAKDEILKEFNATVKDANKELAKFKSSRPKPTAVKLAAATNVKNSRIAAAIVSRDAALKELGSLGNAPSKPVVKTPTPAPSPTKKKQR